MTRLEQLLCDSSDPRTARAGPSALVALPIALCPEAVKIFVHRVLPHGPSRQGWNPIVFENEWMGAFKAWHGLWFSSIPATRASHHAPCLLCRQSSYPTGHGTKIAHRAARQAPSPCLGWSILLVEVGQRASVSRAKQNALICNSIKHTLTG